MGLIGNTGLYFKVAEEETSTTMKMTFTFDNDSTTLLMPTSGTNNYEIDWGDDSVETITSTNPSHTYDTSGTYQVSITGTCPIIRAYGAGVFQSYLVSVDQWGDLGFTQLNEMFLNCTNLASLPSTGSIYPGTTTEAYYMFNGCTSLTTIPSNLFKNCTDITTVSGCFQECTSLTSIPNNLFYYCSSMLDYSYIFYKVPSLEYPTNLFNTSYLSIATGFEYAFYESSESNSWTGTAQEIWNYSTPETYNNCFTNQTSLDNYSDAETAGWV